MQVNGPINDDVANLIVAQLLFLESENPEKPVSPPILASSSLISQQCHSKTKPVLLLYSRLAFAKLAVCLHNGKSSHLKGSFAKADLPMMLQISMYINSPGGVVSSGLAIYDTMQVDKGL